MFSEPETEQPELDLARMSIMAPFLRNSRVRLIRPANSGSRAASSESLWDSNWALKSCLTLGTSGYVSAVPNHVFWNDAEVGSARLMVQGVAVGGISKDFGTGAIRSGHYGTCILVTFASGAERNRLNSCSGLG